MLKWLTGFIIGGGIAATVQGGTVLARLASTSLTAGTGNPIVAAGEHVASFASSLLSLVIPFVVVTILVLSLIVILVIFRKRLFRAKMLL